MTDCQKENQFDTEGCWSESFRVREDVYILLSVMFSGASQADDKCYEKFNAAGNFNGHCGQTGEESFRKCELQ